MKVMRVTVTRGVTVTREGYGDTWRVTVTRGGLRGYGDTCINP